MMNEISPGSAAVMRRCQRVLRMVHELHKRGYQRLRIAPGMSSSGCHWRCAVTHVGNILRSHGALMRSFDTDVAHYTTGQDNEFFGWTDAKRMNARQLADLFVERFPEIARAGQGDDWEYAGWYVRMLGLAEQEALPIAYDDWDERPDPAWLPTMRRIAGDLAMPPGGLAEGSVDGFD